MATFRKATKSTARLRMALVGPSGSGKTFSALAIAAGLGRRVAVIDTEHGSASKYAGKFEFDVVELGNFDPRNYIEAIQAAEAERYDVLIVDSLSHAWSGKGGALEQVDKAAKRSRSNNTFTAWRDVTPLHNSLVDAIIASRCHVIATMRTKVDYVMEADPSTGKTSPRKVGMAPIQREGMDYEFDIVCDLDLDHTLLVGKTRCDAIDRMVIARPGPVFGQTLRDWLADGTPSPAAPPAILPADMVAEVNRLTVAVGMNEFQVRSALSRRGVSSIDRLSIEDAQGLINQLESIASQAEFAQRIGLPDPSAAAPGSHVAESPEGIAPDTSDPSPDDHVIPGATRVARGELAGVAS